MVNRLKNIQTFGQHIDENKDISNVTDSKFTKNEVIRLMEWARDRGEHDGEILWKEWMDEVFDRFDKIRHNIK